MFNSIDWSLHNTYTFSRAAFKGDNVLISFMDFDDYC